MLQDLDIELVFAFLKHPVKVIGTQAETLFPEVDEGTHQRLRQRRAYLVIDQSNEGYRHVAEFSELLHAWCRLRAVPPSTLLYVTANTAYARQYHEWCDETNQAERISHLHFNAYVHEVALANSMMPETADGTRLLHRHPRTHRFLSFNHAPRPERILLAAQLLSVDPPDALVSLGTGKGTIAAAASVKQAMKRYGRGRLLRQHRGLFGRLEFDVLQSRTTLPEPEPTRGEPLYRDFALQEYARSYVSVVTETEMTGGSIRRVTEKTVKPFLFGHLAVLVGNPGALDLVRGMGFSTFHPIIDEGYDKITDPLDRLCAVICEVDRLRGIGVTELHARFLELEEVRRANLRLGHDVLARRLAAEACSAVTRRLLDGAPESRILLGDCSAGARDVLGHLVQLNVEPVQLSEPCENVRVDAVESRSLAVHVRPRHRRQRPSGDALDDRPARVQLVGHEHCGEVTIYVHHGLVQQVVRAVAEAEPCSCCDVAGHPIVDGKPPLPEDPVLQ